MKTELIARMCRLTGIFIVRTMIKGPFSMLHTFVGS